MINKLEDFVFSFGQQSDSFFSINSSHSLGRWISFHVVSFCGFLELSAADDEQLKIKQFLRKSQKHLKIHLQSKKPRNSNTSAQFPQFIIDQRIETTLKKKKPQDALKLSSKYNQIEKSEINDEKCLFFIWESARLWRRFKKEVMG